MRMGWGKFWIGREVDADADEMGKYLMGRENFGLDGRRMRMRRGKDGENFGLDGRRMRMQRGWENI